MQMQVRIRSTVLIALFNILVISILGGRIAAVVCVVMLFIACLCSKKIGFWKKIAICGVVLGAIFFLMENFGKVVVEINSLLATYGIKSRSITLLVEQMSSGHLYVTNRDMIYGVTIEYIRDRMVLPGGFGIALYLTDGKYYYVHNCFLQLLVVFGVPGALTIIAVIIARLYRFKMILPSNAFRLLLFMLLSYLLIGFTGSSFFIHFLATIFIALFFFGEDVLRNMEG